jgi:hypothetical protein
MRFGVTTNATFNALSLRDTQRPAWHCCVPQSLSTTHVFCSAVAESAELKLQAGSPAALSAASEPETSLQSQDFTQISAADARVEALGASAPSA